MNKNTQIKKEIENIIKKMGISGKVTESKKNDLVYYDIVTEDAALLIGYRGEHLEALQHITKILVYQKNPQDFPRFVLDINSYRQQKITKVEDLAQRIIDKVLKTRKLEVLPPMNSYERKIVHTKLSEIEDLITESIGEEPNRRVVVKIRK